MEFNKNLTYVPEKETTPAAYYENDTRDYDSYMCTSCNDVHSIKIYFNHLNYGNICEKCLNEEDLPFIMGMNKKEFSNFKKKVLNQLPSNPL